MNKYTNYIQRISNVYAYDNANEQNINNFKSLSKDDKDSVLYNQTVCDDLNTILYNFPKTNKGIQKVFNHFYNDVLIGNAKDDFALDVPNVNNVGKKQRELIKSNIGVSLLDISDTTKDDYGVLIDK